MILSIDGRSGERQDENFDVSERGFIRHHPRDVVTVKTV